MTTSASMRHDLFLVSGAAPSGMRTRPGKKVKALRPAVRLGRLETSRRSTLLLSMGRTLYFSASAQKSSLSSLSLAGSEAARFWDWEKSSVMW